MRTAAEWADENRILPPESPEPGRWRSSRTPYMAGIYEAFTNPKHSMITVVMGAQMGKTEAQFNIIGHRMDDGPQVPALYIGPTQKQVKSVSEDRVMKMLRTTPTLWEKLEKGNRNRMTEKYIAGVRLGFGWAGSATELASHPAGLVLVDERDRMDDDVSGEGDPVTLSQARTKNFPNSKVGVFSTPTIEGASPIWGLYESGTMYKWAWPCPHCSDCFVPEIKLLIWPEGANKQQALEEAKLACPHCGGMMDGKDKQKMNQNGRYIPHKLDDTGEHIPLDEPLPNSNASFWVSGLASPWQSFGQIAEKLVEAYKSNEIERIQAVVNTYAGEIFKMRGDAPDWKQVQALAIDNKPNTLPEGVQMVVAGVDVQKYGLYYVVRGFGFNSESWLVAHGFIAGETEFDNVWILLSRLLEQNFGDGRVIERMFVDSGYNADQVYAFCRRHPGKAFPTKGHDTQDRPIKMVNLDVTVGGRLHKGGVKLWHMDTDHMKSWVYSRIRWPEGESGGFHLHSEVDEDYCKQVVSEELVIKASGRRVWVQRQKDNHYLDCETNAYAAALSLQVQTLKPIESKPQNATHPQKTSNNNSSFIQRPSGSFIR